MASSSGSSPASHRPSFKCRRRLWLAALILLALPAAAIGEARPDYLHAALTRFSPNPPADWAYTLTTVRDEFRMRERFDPALPSGGQWTLLEWQGHAPTTTEQENYARSRPAGAGGARANFQTADIEPSSLRLVREDAEWADFVGDFREIAAGTDKMLGHLRIRLFVHKAPAYVGKYQLELKSPYSPVLTVRMDELFVEATFDAPEGDSPSLPGAQTSRFRGRFLIFPKTETLALIYSDFQRHPRSELSR